MSITSANLKFRQSERMTDFDDGGGHMSNVEIVDGQMDNIFPDRSDLDGIIGNVSLRKTFLQVASTNTDTYRGAMVFLSDPPSDPLIEVSMFATGSPTDVRTDAETYVENYRIESVKTQFILYGNHIVGQQTIQVYCRDSTISSPNVGDVLELSIEASGYTPQKQFVKVDQVLSRQTLTFEDSGGTFQRDVLIVQITSPLQYAFPGQEDPQRITGANPPPTKIRFTQAASTSTYYGIKPLALSAAIGDLMVKVTTPFISVVPAAQSESPIVDVLAGEGSIVMCQSGVSNALTFSGAATIAAGGSVTRYFGSPYLPGTLSITMAGSSLIDDGIGNISSATDSSWSGIADYQNGAITVSRSTAASGTLTATATPAGAVQQQTQSMQIPITAGNRGIAYVRQIPVPPVPGTVMVDYLALGQWVRLYDTGGGTVSGNPGEGTGTLNYSTGSLALTLGSQPDVGSSIIIYWGTKLRTRNVSGEITVATPQLTQQLAHGGNMPGTCTLTWTSATVSKSATVSGNGTLSGNATGRWDFSAGLVAFVPDSTPDAGFTFGYSYVDPTKLHTETFTPSVSSGQVSFTLAHSAASGTVSAQWTDDLANGTAHWFYAAAAHDDGSGGWIGPGAGTNNINYSTGAITLFVDYLGNMYNPAYTFDTLGLNGQVTSWTSASTHVPYLAGSPIVVKYVESGASVTATTETHSAGPFAIDMSAGSTGAAVPGSVRFTFRGRTYVDRNGSLYYGIDPTTNAGTLGGNYNYDGNIATLTDYAAGSNTVAINSLLTRYATVGVSAVYFRTHGAPLALSSFIARATDLLGNAINATSDVNGVISGTGVRGNVDQDTGVTSLEFGAMVTAAGNESQPWYNAANIVGTQIWKPTIVDPSTIFTGYVVLKYVPQTPGLLGLDPVRLPSNGKVPGFQKGGAVAIHNTQTVSLTPTAGSTTNLGRTRLDFVEIVDSSAMPVSIDPVWYQIGGTPGDGLDLQAGTVTWANPLNLSAYVLPVVIRHRILDRSQVSDIQVTGEISLQSALTHAFPATGTYVSAMLLIGNMQARETNQFDQQTWTSVWSDVVIGSPATSNYDNINYPVQVRNDSAVDSRWALVFQSPSSVQVISEVYGNLGTFSISSDIAPVNPVSGTPYATWSHSGFGSGWSAGNVIRDQTISATYPIWLLRCISQGASNEDTQSMRLNGYGNAA